MSEHAPAPAAQPVSDEAVATVPAARPGPLSNLKPGTFEFAQHMCLAVGDPAHLLALRLGVTDPDVWGERKQLALSGWVLSDLLKGSGVKAAGDNGGAWSFTNTVQVLTEDSEVQSVYPLKPDEAAKLKFAKQVVPLVTDDKGEGGKRLAGAGFIVQCDAESAGLTCASPCFFALSSRQSVPLTLLPCASLL